MNSSVLFFLCTFAVIATAFVYPRHVADKFCDCIPLKNCHSAFSKLKSSHKDPTKHKAFTKYLDIINCGYIRHEPQVCCPNEIPNEVNEIVDNKKYWTEFQEQKSIKKLKRIHLKTKSSTIPSKFLDTLHKEFSDPPKHEGQHFECGRYLRHENFGNLTEISDYPWLALLEYDTGNGKKLLCGGALVSDQHILTAARCVTSRSNKLISVILGEYDTSSEQDCTLDGNPENTSICADLPKKYEIDNYVVHEDYNDGISHRELTMDDMLAELHDVALLKLKQKVKFTEYIQPICLPSMQSKARRYVVSGWGRSFVPDAQGSSRKLMSYVSEPKGDECEKAELQQLFDKDEHICVGDSSRREQPCIVDSGGPLMGFERKEDGSVRMTVYGVSYMETTCESRGQPRDLPGIFTNVFNYKDWIVEHMHA